MLLKNAGLKAKEQANSNEINDDSERNKEIKKNPDYQKEKYDNQDSKDEVKSPASKFILLPLFIVLGLAVVCCYCLVARVSAKINLLDQEEYLLKMAMNKRKKMLFTYEEFGEANDYDVWKTTVLKFH